MTMMEASKNVIGKKLINPNLMSLKCLLFVFFGGMGCLFPFLPLHMLAVGLTLEEARLVSIISPIIAILGPVTAGPLADRLAGRQGSNNRDSTGRYLRVMIVVACICSAIFYSLLLLVPSVSRIELPQERRPSLRFSCDQNGATIHQERCRDSTSCYQWPEERVGVIRLKDCKYTCKPIVPRTPTSAAHTEETEESKKMKTTTILSFDSTEYVDLTESSGDIAVSPLEADPETFQGERERRSSTSRRHDSNDNEPPHLCFNNSDNFVCHVYTEYSNDVLVNATLKQATNAAETQEWCTYPILEYFSCRIPSQLETKMAEINQTCSVECDLNEPYTITGSTLAESQCQQVIGDPVLTFWIYVVVRSIADIFPTTAVALLDAAVVIATRENSCGRGDVGRQLAFGSLGFAALGPLTGYLSTLMPPTPAYFLPIVMFSMLMLIAAVIAISANGMPLSPPEWWWHTRSGMLALPMSAVKRYGSETAALILVLMVMGIFWSVMDSYLPLHLISLKGDDLLIGITLTVGALPAVLFLWKSEHLVDYCGHSNLLITAFTIYIVRFTGLSLISDPWWALASEALELFTLGIMWVTTILYLRHLVPRHLTVTAQALPVIAHFCIGRCIGAVIGAYVNVSESTVESLRFVYRSMAVAAAIVAAVYFVLYHALLKPRCHAQTTHGPRQPPTIVQAMNGNGNYTPLRVYHNGGGRKGQFRY